MLVGRAFQGVGSGIILSLVEIVQADLIPLSQRYVLSTLFVVGAGISDALHADRGNFQGAFGAIWSLASAVGSSSTPFQSPRPKADIAKTVSQVP